MTSGPHRSISLIHDATPARQCDTQAALDTRRRRTLARGACRCLARSRPGPARGRRRTPSSVLAKREAALAAPRNDYDPLYVSRWWHILLGVTRVLERYRTPFVGKSSPVQFWWGSFDLATTCGIALIMVLAARLHARRKEPGAIAVNVVLLALAVLVAWGASARTPSEPASGYAMRLTVFGGTSPPDSSSSSKPCRAATPSRPSRVTRPNWPPGRDRPSSREC